MCFLPSWISSIRFKVYADPGTRACQKRRRKSNMVRNRSVEQGKEEEPSVGPALGGTGRIAWRVRGTAPAGLPAKEIHGVGSRHLGRIKALFLNLSIPIPAFEARNSLGIAGAPYGEHTPLQDGAREQGQAACAVHVISFQCWAFIQVLALSKHGANLIVLKVAYK